MWPDYLKLKTLARRLDLEVGHVEQMVKRGALPPPIEVDGTKLWRWSDVDGYLRLGRHEPADDPIMRAINEAPTSRVQGHKPSRASVLLPATPPRD